MNIWSLLFITVFFLWLFCEYLRYVGKKLIELSKDYNKLVKMRKDMENTVIKFSKEIHKEKFAEVFEDEFIIGCDGHGHEEITLERRFFIALIRKYFSIEAYEFHSKVKISVKKGKIVIERIENKE